MLRVNSTEKFCEQEEREEWEMSFRQQGKQASVPVEADRSLAAINLLTTISTRFGPFQSLNITS